MFTLRNPLRVRKSLKQAIYGSRGSSLTEYGISVGLIALIATLAVAGFGQKTKETFETVGTAISSQNIGEPDEYMAGESEELAFDYTDPSTYPDEEDCYAVGGSSDYYDANYTCFTTDLTDSYYIDYSTETSENLVIKPLDLGLSEQGWSGSVVVTNDATLIWEETTLSSTPEIYFIGNGENYISLPTQNCSELTFEINYEDMLVITLLDRSAIYTLPDLDGLYCGGDDTVLSNADMLGNLFSDSDEWTDDDSVDTPNYDFNQLDENDWYVVLDSQSSNSTYTFTGDIYTDALYVEVEDPVANYDNLKVQEITLNLPETGDSNDIILNNISESEDLPWGASSEGDVRASVERYGEYSFQIRIFGAPTGTPLSHSTYTLNTIINVTGKLDWVIFYTNNIKGSKTTINAQNLSILM